METQLHRTEWHGVEAWTLANSDLSVTMVPAMGAKIVSLVDLKGETEWLIDSGKRPFQPVDYGASFEKQDMSGWDEMFPTIVACPYPGAGKYHGASLPDHGEAWCLPWQIIAGESDRLVVTLRGRALPYQLTRTADFPAPATLRLRYTLNNLGSEPMPYMWAAHPQFTCGQDGQVLLPPEITEVINTVDEAWGWGTPETRFGWPQAIGLNGKAVRPDLIGPPSLKHARKFFALAQDRPGWVALLRRGSGQWIRFEWDSCEVPYFGLWIDEGALNHDSVATPEPTTGWYDDLAFAFEKDEITILPAGAACSWTLTVRLGGDGQPTLGI